MVKKASSPKSIKPKKGWSRHCKPWIPMAPKKPEKSFSTEDFTPFYSTPLSEVSLSDVEIPEGVSSSKVVIRTLVSGDYYDKVGLEFGVYVTTTHINDRYNEELEQYKKNYAKYLKDKKSYKQEVADWEAWMAQEKGKDSKREIARAEAILKKHGRL